MRALLTPMFSAQRMRALQPRVEALAGDLLDALAARTPPADLHEALSVPLPVLVICELLGVPGEERARFRAWSQDMADLHDRQRASAALGNLTGYMRQLVAHKRACPAGDVISSLCAAHGGVIPDEQVAHLAAMLLFAGHETTVVQIDLGTLMLLVNPDQRERLAGDPSLLTSAVEEILRASLGGGGGLPRYAHETIEVGGVTIRAGEAVLLDIGAANHDQRAFTDPDRLDISRHSNPHLTFGHGPWYCIGAPLARVELHAVFSRLIARLPTLRLATSIDKLRIRDDLLTGGLAELPVTW